MVASQRPIHPLFCSKDPHWAWLREAHTPHIPRSKDPHWAWSQDRGSHPHTSRSKAGHGREWEAHTPSPLLERSALGMFARQRLTPLTSPAQKTSTGHGRETEAHTPRSKDPHWAWLRDGGTHSLNPHLRDPHLAWLLAGNNPVPIIGGLHTQFLSKPDD